MSDELTNEDYITMEQIYLEYCAFQTSRGEPFKTRVEFGNSIMEIGDRSGNCTEFIKGLIRDHKMKKNCELN
jgi:hypothetical protein